MGVQPIALANFEEGNVPGDNGSPVTVAGWGTTRERGRVADVLRAVQLETMNNKKCKKSYSWIGSGQVIKHYCNYHAHN